jgi:hypothetical protein
LFSAAINHPNKKVYSSSLRSFSLLAEGYASCFVDTLYCKNSQGCFHSEKNLELESYEPSFFKSHVELLSIKHAILHELSSRL